MQDEVPFCLCEVANRVISLGAALAVLTGRVRGMLWVLGIEWRSHCPVAPAQQGDLKEPLLSSAQLSAFEDVPGSHLAQPL